MQKMDANFIWNIIFYGIVIVPAIFLLSLKFRKSRIEKMLLKIPGPDYNFLFGNALQIVAPREDIFQNFWAITRKYADESIFRMWLGSSARVIFIKARAAEVVLSSNRLLDKATDYTSLHPWLATGLLTSTGLKWHRRRKLITPTFHFRILDTFLNVFNEQAIILVSNLKSKHEGKGPFNIYPYLGRCTLDVICETAMGKKIDAQSHSESDYVTAVNSMSEIVNKRSLSPWLHPEWLFKLSSYGRLQDKSLKILHNFTNQVITERRIVSQQKSYSPTNGGEDQGIFGEKHRLAFLDMLLESTIDGKKLTNEDIREEVDTFMFEGHDTTSSALSWILYSIGRFPEIQKKVHEELDRVLDLDSNEHITNKHLNELKFLECVIKESMRLFPPVPFFARHITEDTEVCGHRIPKGAEAVFSVYAIHRDPEFFPDPEKFDPDRFLSENCVNRHPYAYIPFSAGPRNCIGQKFALMEEKVVIAQVMRRFQVTSIEKVENMKLLSELILRPAHGIWLKLESRNNA